MPTVLLGSEAEMADAVIERRERYGVSYLVVRDHQLPAAAALARRLA